MPGSITPAQRAAVGRCLRTGSCDEAGVERGLDTVVDRVVTGVVETTTSPPRGAARGLT